MQGLRDSATLCPAGHLPREGGDQPAATVLPRLGGCRMGANMTRVISLLAGEMSGRTEGGAVER